MKAQVTVKITYITDVPDDPEYYGGATTPEARTAKEREYIEEDGGDYLMQSLACTRYDITATVEPIFGAAELRSEASQ
jgi:hypothetical protein